MHRRTELMQRAHVNAPFEIDYFIDRPPKVNPTDAIKLGLVASIKAHRVWT